jgi:hypothetical protein
MLESRVEKSTQQHYCLKYRKRAPIERDRSNSRTRTLKFKQIINSFQNWKDNESDRKRNENLAIVFAYHVLSGARSAGLRSNKGGEISKELLNI